MSLQEIARYYYEWLIINGFDKAVAWSRAMDLIQAGAKQ